MLRGGGGGGGVNSASGKAVITCTCYLTRALIVHKTKSCPQTAAVAVTVLTQRVTIEGRGRALAAATRVTTCALFAVITCHAVAVFPCADAASWITPLQTTLMCQ